MIVDAHVHFWDPRELRYPWLADVPPLERPFLPSDYARACAATGVVVDRVLVVECNCLPEQCQREVEHFEALAGGAVPIAGIVAFVDVAGARRRDHALAALALAPLVKGVRQNIQGEAPGFCIRAEFVDGVQEIGDRGLVFDLCATHDQLGDVVELVARCPGTRFVLDHCGKPAIRLGQREPWRTAVSRLAEHDNVWCKLSGLLTEAAPHAWRDDDLLPYASHVVDRFGRRRVMFGSDWPVLTTAGRLADWFGFTRRFTAGWSEGDAHRFYADTATHVYGL